MKNFKLFLLVFAILQMTASFNAQNGLNFDGANDYISTNYAGIAGNNPRTVEAWIKAPFTSGQVVITDWGTNSTGGRSTFALNNGNLRVEVGGNGNSGPLVADNTWHHVAYTYDNASSPKYNTYIDGVLVGSFNLTVSTNTGTTVPLQIGLRVLADKPFNGIIDEVKVWNYARTQTEISTDMNTEYCASQLGLVAYHKLNSGIAGGSNSGITTSVDNSGAGNNGTLNGFSLSGTTSNWVSAQSLTTSYETGSQTLSECDGFSVIVGGNTYSTTGIYLDTLLGASSYGCDSIVTTDLTVASAINNSTSTVGAIITAGATSATYQWLDCDNSFVVMPGETGQSFTATTEGNYAVEITVGNCTDTSSCENIVLTGLNDNDFKKSISVFPNPTHGQVKLSTIGNAVSTSVEIIDITGKVVLEFKSNDNEIVLDLSVLDKGIYFVKTIDGTNISSTKLVKL